MTSVFKPILMVMLFFSCTNAQGEYTDCMYGGPTLEAAFDLLNDLVRNGSQLIAIQLRYRHLPLTQLPVEAFDGCVVGDFLKELEEEWTLALLT